MKKFLSKKTTLLFSAGVLLFSSQFLKAQETSNLTNESCHCWHFSIFGAHIASHCNKACDADNSPTTNSGWDWF